MEFNAKKCEVLKVAHTRSIIDKDYYLSGTKLDRIDVKKDLGVLVSHGLSWNNHVYLISSKAQIMLNLLYRTCRDILILVQRNCFTLLGFGRDLNLLAWYDHLIPKETSII